MPNNRTISNRQAAKPAGFLLAGVLPLLLLFPFFAAPAAAAERDEIMFLHVRVSTNGVQLVKAQVRPGRFKAAPTKGPIEVELRDSKDATIFTVSSPDPLVTRFEFEDPEQPGRLVCREIRQDHAEYVLRAPRLPGASKARFYRRARAQESGLRAQAVREFIGEVQIPGDTGK